MLSRLFPSRIDNTFAGSKIALVLLGALFLVKGVIGFNSMVFGRMVAGDADGIPVASYPAACVQAIVSLYGTWGATMFVLCAFGVLVLFRYRAMVPLVFLLLLCEQLLRRFSDAAHPIAMNAAAGGAINLAFFALLILGLVLSLWVPWRRAEPSFQ